MGFLAEGWGGLWSLKLHDEGSAATKGFADEKFQGVCTFSDLPTIASLYDTEEKQRGLLRGRE